jgi:hypothetical protein
VNKQDPLTPSLVVENPHQAVRIRAWWATIEEAIAAAGGVTQALNLVAPESYYEDQLFWLLELDWERFPRAIGKDGNPLGGLSIAWAREAQSGRVRDKLSEWAKAVKLAVSPEPPPTEPGQSSRAVGRRRRPGSEDAGPREVRHAAQNVVPMRFGRPQQQPGHAFISYVREDSHEVDKLQRTLEAAGVSVWRDTADLWPGENWRVKIRRAITDDALAFIACFSSRSVARRKSYQNEELVLAIEQLRQRQPDDIWLIPVRLDDCDIPDLDLGGGQTLGSIQRVDLFGAEREIAIERLVTAVVRILGRGHDQQAAWQTGHASSSPAAADEWPRAAEQTIIVAGQSQASSPLRSVGADIRPQRPTTDSVDIKARFSTAGDPLPAVSGHGSQVLEIDLPSDRYLVKWSKQGEHYLSVRDETEGLYLVLGNRELSSGEKVVHIQKSGPHLLSVKADDLDWSFTPISI